MTRRITLITLIVLATLSWLGGSPATAATDWIDFEKETAQIVEDFTSITNISFRSGRIWQRVDITEAALFDNLAGIVIADVSFESAALIIDFSQPAQSLTFAYGLGYYQTDTTITVIGYADGLEVFHQQFTPIINRQGFYEGLAVVNVAVDQIIVQATDQRALLALDNIQQFDVRLADTDAIFAAIALDTPDKEADSFCLLEDVVDGYRLLPNLKHIETPGLAVCGAW